MDVCVWNRLLSEIFFYFCWLLRDRLVFSYFISVCHFLNLLFFDNFWLFFGNVFSGYFRFQRRLFWILLRRLLRSTFALSLFLVNFLLKLLVSLQKIFHDINVWLAMRVLLFEKLKNFVRILPLRMLAVKTQIQQAESWRPRQ